MSASRLRITLVVHQYPPKYFTGTEQYAHSVGQALQRRGHDVDIFTLDPYFLKSPGVWRENRELVDGLPVRRVSFWAGIEPDWNRLDFRHPMMAETFADHLAERRPQVVHCFHLRMVGADLVDRIVEFGSRLIVSLMDFWWLCPRVIMMRSDGEACLGPPRDDLGCIPCHAPQLATDDSKDSAEAHRTALQAASPDLAFSDDTNEQRRMSLLSRPDYLLKRLRQADVLIAPTRFLADVFTRNGAPTEKLRHLSYGVDTTALEKVRTTSRTNPGRPITFGFFGTLIEHKAPHVIVEAMQHVKSECRVLIRGRTEDFPAYSLPLLQRAAEDPRIEIGDAFPHEELSSVLAQIDILVVPSLWHENSPFVVLEARAAGLPVLASRHGGMTEVIKDEVDGELFEPGASADLGRRIQRLLDEPDRLTRYRDAVTPPKPLETAINEIEATYYDHKLE